MFTFAFNSNSNIEFTRVGGWILWLRIVREINRGNRGKLGDKRMIIDYGLRVNKSANNKINGKTGVWS